MIMTSYGTCISYLNRFFDIITMSQVLEINNIDLGVSVSEM